MCSRYTDEKFAAHLAPVYHMFKKSSTHSQLLAVGCGVACFPRCLFCCTQSVAPSVCPLRSWSPNLLESEQHLAQFFSPCIKLVFVAGKSGRAKGRSTCATSKAIRLGPGCPFESLKVSIAYLHHHSDESVEAYQVNRDFNLVGLLRRWPRSLRFQLPHAWQMFMFGFGFEDVPWLPCSIHIRKQMPMFQSCSDQRWVLAARISTVSMKGALCQWRAAVAASVVFSELHHATSCSLPSLPLSEQFSALRVPLEGSTFDEGMPLCSCRGVCLTPSQSF